MKSFTITTALLLGCFCWGTKSYTLMVKPGGDVILSCRIISIKTVHTFWSMLPNSGNYSCIDSMDEKRIKFCDKFSDDRFNMSSNSSHVLLKIRHVKMNDSGFYFCGFDVFGNGKVSVVHLIVEDVDPGSDHDTGSKCENNPKWWMIMTLGGLCVLLLTITVGFAVKIKRLRTVATRNGEENAPGENLPSENLNYTALNFKQKTRRARRADCIETRVIYAATR